MSLQKTRQATLQRIVAHYDGIQGQGIPSGPLGRLALIERNVGGSTPRYTLTTHHSPTDAAAYWESQDCREDWEVEALVNLHTGETSLPVISMSFMVTDTTTFGPEADGSANPELESGSTP